MWSGPKGRPPSPSTASLNLSSPINDSVVNRCLTLLANLHQVRGPLSSFRSINNAGEMIGSGWVRRSEDSKAELLSQLADKIREMRELRPSQDRIASVDGGSLYDCRVAGPTLRFGPFDTVQDFHRHLRQVMEFDSRLNSEIQELIKQQSNSWPLAFTHGDLSSLNILVRGNDIVGIIDWETAGWYPSYWEYTTAYQVNPQNSFWINEIDKFLQPMPEELAMERVRQKYFGDIPDF
ncbi:Aminoglycoside phosphotransferase [Penicillium ucsense]|uniref:Aminoglycoside phosphotransferase n=1 Tax=Penicillium ucsense TaxID=2839758 RepID=A0A8J8W1K2_9EURO|nr:Aminoglycoside phosphotransferase [Penicillium ucsense]KAF7734179.1 Aminoglycoside phosphotransferase [Penicillium ucsense]